MLHFSLPVPEKDALLHAMTTIQKNHCEELSLQQFYDQIKADHPLWVFDMKTLEAARRNRVFARRPSPAETNESQKVNDVTMASPSADVPSAHSDTKLAPESDTLSVEFRFRVLNIGDPPHMKTTITKSVPEKLCQPDVPAEDVVKVIEPLTRKIAHKEVLTQHPYRCWFCEGRANLIMDGAGSILLHRRPPVVNQLCAPFCNFKSPCFDKVCEWRVKSTAKVSRADVEAYNAASNQSTPIGRRLGSMVGGANALLPFIGQ